MGWGFVRRSRAGAERASETAETPLSVEGSPAQVHESSDQPDQPIVGRARRAWAGTRLVALIAGVAVISLLVGIGVMQFIVSPAEVAARTAAPEAGPITAPIEERSIENTVVTRGEVTYADAVAVTIDSGAAGDRPVITGHVPEVGAVLQSGSIALEIAGRPVIVLPGELPAYRSLSVGMRGPDVVQLKAALGALGYAAGDLGNDTFEWDTAAAVGAVYDQIGYAPATGGDEAADALQNAERAVRDANVSLAQAQSALNQARAAANEAAEAGAAAADLLAEQAAVTSANDLLSDAQDELATAQERVLPTLPSSEVLFLSDLPRRVDDVSVSRGDVLSGSPMSVSGATLTIVGTVSAQDAELLVEGAVATFPGPDGADMQATVASIEAPKKRSGGSANSGDGETSGSDGGSSSGSGGDADTSSRYTVNFAPSDLTSDQIEALRGTNVRVRVPVASTDGDVLAVPIAALSSGSGGQDRVELLVNLRHGADAETELINVTAGLAADGYVEISSDDQRIASGVKVVVGR